MVKILNREVVLYTEQYIMDALTVRFYYFDMEPIQNYWMKIHVAHFKMFVAYQMIPANHKCKAIYKLLKVK